MEVELDTHFKGKGLKVKGKVDVKLAMPAFLPRLRPVEAENSTLVLHGEAGRRGTQKQQQQEEEDLWLPATLSCSSISTSTTPTPCDPA